MYIILRSHPELSPQNSLKLPKSKSTAKFNFPSQFQCNPPNPVQFTYIQQCRLNQRHGSFVDYNGLCPCTINLVRLIKANEHGMSFRER